MWQKPQPFIVFIKVTKVTAGPKLVINYLRKKQPVPRKKQPSPIGTAGPRRGPTFNNRWWNDRRSWNLRTTNSREKASPKGANHIQSCSCSPPSGTIESMSAIRRFHSLRSFHQRLFTFAPFGDGRMRLAKLELHDKTKFF